MIVNTRKAATSSRRHATLSKRAVKNTDGVYRLPFFFQCNMDIKDVIAALCHVCSSRQELESLVTRGQILDIVQSTLIEDGIAPIKSIRSQSALYESESIKVIATRKVTQLFPDFFPKFARPRK